MGKRRRAAKKAVKKVRPTVAKVFKCLFCNHDSSVTCSIDIKSMTGELKCGICDAKFQTKTNSLTEPIDIFTEWLDETTEAQAEATNSVLKQSRQQRSLESTNEGDIFDDGDRDDYD